MGNSSHRVLLLAEDDPDIAFLICRECRSLLSGWEICHVHHGASALARLREYPSPDVLITDLQMPVMDGFKLIDQIREVKAWGALPIFVLTSSIDASARVRCGERKVDGFFRKDNSGIRDTCLSVAQWFDGDPALVSSTVVEVPSQLP